MVLACHAWRAVLRCDVLHPTILMTQLRAMPLQLPSTFCDVRVSASYPFGISGAFCGREVRGAMPT